MASNTLHGRYKLYKRGTEKVVDWLVKTANNCCDITLIIKSLQHKHKDGTKETKEKCTSTPKAHIKGRELALLAEAIASAEPPIDIPSTILDVVNEVIAGRKSCAGWYAAQSATEGDEMARENAGHAHFIRILEKVQDTLTSTKKAQAKSNSTTTSAKSAGTTSTGAKKNEDLTNLFTCLEVEEPSVSATAERTSAPSSKVHENVAFEVQDGGDQAFAIWCLFEDLYDIRSFVIDTWFEYSNGDVSLLATTVTTDIAFGLMRRANNDFIAAHPQFKDYNVALAFLGVSAMIAGEQTIMYTAEGAPASMGHSAGTDPGNLLCHSASISLDVFRLDVFQSIASRLGLPERPYDECDDLYSRLRALKHHAFGQLILNMVPHIADCFVARTQEMRQYGSVESTGDEFLEGLLRYSHDDKLPIWFVVACQTSMDIHDFTQSNPAVGADALCDWLLSTKDCVSKYQRLTETFKERFLEPFWTPAFDALVAKNAALVESIQAIKAGGTYGEQKHEEDKCFDCVDGVPLRPVIDLPVTAGVKLYKNKVALHVFGTMIANDGAVVLAIVHLYRAARYYGLVKSAWHDMDFLLDQ